MGNLILFMIKVVCLLIRPYPLIEEVTVTILLSFQVIGYHFIMSGRFEFEAVSFDTGENISVTGGMFDLFIKPDLLGFDYDNYENP